MGNGKMRIPHKIRRHGKASRRRERGQGLLEISLLLPLFLIIIIGVVEVADAFHSYITLVDAGRDGARLGSKNVATDSDIVNLVLREVLSLW